jgi:hypothetical protein
VCDSCNRCDSYLGDARICNEDSIIETDDNEDFTFDSKNIESLRLFWDKIHLRVSGQDGCANIVAIEQVCFKSSHLLFF